MFTPHNSDHSNIVPRHSITTTTAYTHSHIILNIIHSTWHCKSKHYHYHSAPLFSTCLQSHVNLYLSFPNS